MSTATETPKSDGLPEHDGIFVKDVIEVGARTRRRTYVVLERYDGEELTYITLSGDDMEDTALTGQSGPNGVSFRFRDMADVEALGNALVAAARVARDRWGSRPVIALLR